VVDYITVSSQQQHARKFWSLNRALHVNMLYGPGSADLDIRTIMRGNGPSFYGNENQDRNLQDAYNFEVYKQRRQIHIVLLNMNRHRKTNTRV
jgi:hypothetical protein